MRRAISQWTFSKTLRSALNRAAEWGIISAMPLGRIKLRATDENAVVRHLAADEEARLGRRWPRAMTGDARPPVGECLASRS